MKQSLIYSAAIMLVLILTAIATAWPWFKYVRSIEFIAGEVVLRISGPDGRLADPYTYLFTIPSSTIAVGLTILAGVSFLLGMGCCWVFGSRSSN